MPKVESQGIYYVSRSTMNSDQKPFAAPYFSVKVP